jgi:signal peptidase I
VRQMSLRSSRWARLARRTLLLASAAVTGIVIIAFSATALGYDLFVINGGSMAPAVPEGALVIAERVPPASLQAGDVITFRRSTTPDSPVTHRVVRVDSSGSGIEVWTKGDANTSMDPNPLTTDNPISIARVTLPLVGYVLTFLRTRIGQVTLIFLPLTIVAIQTMVGLLKPETSVGSAGRAGPEPTPPTTTPPSTERRRRDWQLASRLDSLVARLTAFTATPARMLASASQSAQESTIARRPQPGATPSRRVQRIQRVVHAPSEMTAEFADLLAGGLQPLNQIAESHAAEREEFEAILSRQVEPLTEYADRLEHSLEKLVEQLKTDDGQIRGAFAGQIEAERARAREVRATIEEAKAPLRRVLSAESAALDALLSPFDDELDSIDALLRRQRRHLVQMVSQLQSNEFRSALDVMRRRADDIGVLASLGETTAEEVLETLGGRVSGPTPTADSPYLSEALKALDHDADTGTSEDRGTRTPSAA